MFAFSYRPFAVSLFLFLFLALCTWAGDWPQFRGPQRDGFWHETNLLQSIPAEGLKIRWRKAAGPEWSSPVIVNGRIFFTDVWMERPLAKERVHCWEETTGEPIWSFSHEVVYGDWAFNPENSTPPSVSPVVEDEKIYWVSSDGYVNCLDTRDGKMIWERDLAKQYELRQLQCRPSPLITSNLLVVFVGGKPGASVIALDKRSGQEVWKALNDPVSNSSPLIVNAGGTQQLIVWTENSVASLDPFTGQIYWREAMFTSNNDSVAAPVVDKNRLLISGLMMQLDDQRPAVKILWPEKKELSRRILSHTSTPFIRGDHVYSARSTGQLVCLEAATGKVVWETNSITDIGNGASIHLTPTDDGTVFMFTDKGDLICARLTPEAYHEAGRFHLVDPTHPFFGRNYAWSPPAYANGHVFARNGKELVCASLRRNP
jgi:outer membrane protein assembly factor BamB